MTKKNKLSEGPIPIPRLEEYYQAFVSHVPENPAQKHFLACQRFSESMYRLENRHLELQSMENEIFDLRNEDYKGNTRSRTLNELQHDFLDKTEAFHQQVYSTISAFAMLLNHFASKDFLRGMPIGAIKQFLDFLKERFPDYKKHIEQLELARDFRSKMVDHIQQHQLHDWMTYSYPHHTSRLGADCVIIYFTPLDGTEPRPFLETPPEHLKSLVYDPRSSYFRLPIGHKNYYMSPHAGNVFLAMHEIASAVLERAKGWKADDTSN